MSRLDGLSENELVTTLTQLRSDLDELKNRQRTSARSGVLSYFVQSASQWDLLTTVGADSDSISVARDIFVTFTGDASQDVAFINLSYSLYINGTDSTHALTPYQTSWTDGTRTASINVYAPSTVVRHVVQAHVQIQTLKQVTIYVKGYAAASQNGTITAQIV